MNKLDIKLFSLRKQEKKNGIRTFGYNYEKYVRLII